MPTYSKSSQLLVFINIKNQLRKNICMLMVVIKQKHLLGSCILRNGFRKAHLIPNILYTTQKIGQILRTTNQAHLWCPSFNFINFLNTKNQKKGCLWLSLSCKDTTSANPKLHLDMPVMPRPSSPNTKTILVGCHYKSSPIIEEY